MNTPIEFTCDCGKKYTIPFPTIGYEITCSCKQKWVVAAGDFGRIGMAKVKGVQTEMNIKAKLIEQLEVLEELQAGCIISAQLPLALEIAKTMLDYIRAIDMADNNEDEPYICPNCEEAELEAMMINDISIASGISSEVVRRVLDAQDEVLEKLD